MNWMSRKVNCCCCGREKPFLATLEINTPEIKGGFICMQCEVTMTYDGLEERKEPLTLEETKKLRSNGLEGRINNG